ncbi:MAG: hypothetical protein QF681_09135 [Vicinamibacterales bacterium]|jgi:hypothetical protein|nr:hypothetical protein [Vicinamibacterales bacterium]
MRHPKMSVLSTLVTVLFLAPAALAGQPASAGRAPDGSPAPRMPWGAPDLQGVWDHGTATPLERPDRYEGREFLTAEEIAEANIQATTFATSERRSELSAERDVGLAYNQFWWDRGLSDGRTALIIDPTDGKIPPRTADAERRADARRAAALPRQNSENPEDRSLWERCLSRGTVRLGGVYNNNFQIFQSEGHVAILLEMVHEMRIIPLDGSGPSDHTPSQWLGRSRGHWEGDTLVVETTHFSGQAPWRGSGEDLKLVERFSRPEANILRYEVTFEDETTWERPWTAALDMPKTDGLLYEYACHERNYGMENLLKGARAIERNSAAR